MPKQEVAQTKIFLIKGKLTILLLVLFFGGFFNFLNENEGIGTTGCEFLIF